MTPLTVFVGPNNGGKSTALDLVRLTRDGTALELSSDDRRLRSFEGLLSQEGPLHLGRRMSPEINLRVGTMPLAFRLADDISFESEYAEFGDSCVLKRRDVFFHPGDKLSSTRQRVLSEVFEVGPPEKRDEKAGEAAPRTFGEESDVRKGKSAANQLWFGFPWEEGRGEIRAEGPSHLSRERPVSRLPEPYHRWVSRELTIDERFVQLALRVLNAIRERTSDQSPTDLTGGPVTFRVEQKELVGSEAEAPPMHFESPQRLLREDLKTPEWVPPGQEDTWREARRRVLGPLIDKIEANLELGFTHVSSFRAQPKPYYGPGDSLTPLLRRYRDAHPVVREEVENWIDVFQLGSELKVESVASGLYAASLKLNGERRYLGDLGSGTAQLLPLILRLAADDSSGILLLEEPESHLHPKLQSRLADLLVKVIGKGHQVLVETHSEHLVRRLQYLVAQGKCEPDHGSVLYIDARRTDEGDFPGVRSLSIDEEGQLSGSFGSEFFDDATDLMQYLFRYETKN